MTFLCVVVLLSLLAYDFGEASYPDQYDIEKSVFGFISHNQETPICGVALITNLYGIAPVAAVMNINFKRTKTFAVIQKDLNLGRDVYEVENMLNEKGNDIRAKSLGYAIIFVKERKEPLPCLLRGLLEPEEIKNINVKRSSLKIYGLTTANQPKAFTVMKIEFVTPESFRLWLDSIPNDINFLGASVLYKRNFVAMCDGKSQTEQVLYCKSALGVVSFILNIQTQKVIRVRSSSSLIQIRDGELEPGYEVAKMILREIDESSISGCGCFPKRSDINTINYRYRI